jgi:hypothetical protein
MQRLKNYVDTALNSNDLAIANVFVGNTSGKAEAVPLSGAVTIDNTGLAIVDDAVTTAKILDGTILAADIAADAVTTAKILDGTILAADIAADAVTTARF